MRNDIAYFDALLNVDVPAARDTARQLVQAEPSSLPHRTTLALAELRLGNGLAAMDVFRGVKLPPPNAMQPRQQAVFAAALWKTSFDREAREVVRVIVPERLLPEERELIRPVSESPFSIEDVPGPGKNETLASGDSGMCDATYRYQSPRMNLLLSAVGLMNVLGLLIVAHAVYTAPDGFEDQSGFHTGDQPLDPNAQRRLVFALKRI